VLSEGEYRADRTGVGIYSLFGEQVKYDLTEGFPLLTSKKVYFKGVAYELIWFLSGDTNIKFLQENKVRIWDEWADSEGNLGPVYGKQWRDWSGVDQIANLIEELKSNPTSRRHLVSAWNVSELLEMALPPCHMTFQFYVRRGEYLDCQLYQRSADLFLGVPFNIASYALLTHVVAKITGLKAGVFTHTMGDVHIYSNHLDQIKEQIRRFENEPRPFPQIELQPIGNIDSFCYGDIRIVGYDPHPPIEGTVAV
jgi:thymidylate synthase